MRNYYSILNNLLRDECGQDLIEYALVASLIALAAVAAIGSVGNTINNVFTSINNKL
jgi:pilus assembly protein Flp/PilA